MSTNFRPTTPEQLLAAEEIRNLVLWYGFCVDNGKLEDLVATFVPDGAWDSTDNGHGRHIGHEAMRAFFGKFPDLRQAYHHLVSSPMFLDIGPDDAHAIVTYTSRIMFNGRNDVVLEAGRYHDHYVRAADGWRFRERVLEHVIPSRTAPRDFVDSNASVGGALD